MIINSLFIYIGLALIFLSYQASINPDAISINSLVQVGTFDIGTDTTTVYAGAGVNPASKVYTINLVNARLNGYFSGLAWRNLEWDFTILIRGYNHLTMTTSTKTSFSFQLDSYYGFFIIRLKFSYIAIDSSLKNYLYVQMLSIPLPTNPPIAPNSYINKTLPITFPGSIQYNITQTLLYSINYQFQVIAGQFAGIYLSRTGLNQTYVNISAYFPYTFTQLSTIKFFILYFIPTQFSSTLIPINYYLISTGQPIGPIILNNNQTIYTNTNFCGISDQNTFVGLESFSKSDRIKFQLYVNSVTVNITAFYQGFRFSMLSICSLGCQNSSYPFFVLNDSRCYDVCPPGTYENFTQITCYKCQDNCLTCQHSASFCLTCVSGTYLYQNSCSNPCPKLNSVYSNLVQNLQTGTCDPLIIKDCVQALFINNVAVCLQCDLTKNLQYNSMSRTCVCKTGYALNNGSCMQYCGDGIIGTMQCDDENLANGDGCSSSCIIQDNFDCIPFQNGPNFISKCKYKPNININILSQTKLEGENTLKMILNISPTPPNLTAKDIQNFLNIKIGNQTLNVSNLHIQYNNGIANIYIPYTKDIQNSQLDLWTNFDVSLYESINSYISQLLKGDNVALLYSQYWNFYQNLSIFSFALSILVCIVAILSAYKHKMIGLQLIIPYQLIFYSQKFYDIDSVSNTIYTGLKPLSFSIFSPNEITSKSNSSYRIFMTGNFLQNYNILGGLFLISSLVFLYFLCRLYLIQNQRFEKKTKFKVWISNIETKSLIQSYKTVIWKPFFVFFSLSTFPLIFAFLSPTNLSNSLIENSIDIISQKFSFLLSTLFLFSLFFTSIPFVFYHNSKNLLKRLVFKHECQVFRYDANYCIIFQLHYLIISLIIIFCQPMIAILYSLATINGLFFFYMLIKRPYLSNLDIIGSTLSCFITFFFTSINLCCYLMQFNNLIIKLYDIFAFVIIGLLIIQLVLTFFRLYFFWKEENLTFQQLYQLKKKRKSKKTPYVRNKALKKFTNKIERSVGNQQQQIHNMMKKAYVKQKMSKDLTKPLIQSQTQEVFIHPNTNLTASIFVQQKNYSTLQRVKMQLRQNYREVYGQNENEYEESGKHEEDKI